MTECIQESGHRQSKYSLVGGQERQQGHTQVYASTGFSVNILIYLGRARVRVSQRVGGIIGRDSEEYEGVIALLIFSLERI